MAVCHISIFKLTHRDREQARSHTKQTGCVLQGGF